MACDVTRDIQTEKTLIYRSKIDQELCAIAKAVLHKDALKPKQSLFEQGLTPVGALEARTRLESRFELSLQSSVLFDYPTLASLGAFVEERLRSARPKPATAPAVLPSGVQALDDAMVHEILKRTFEG